MTAEKTYRFKTLAGIAKRVVYGPLNDGTVSEFVLSAAPNIPLAETHSDTSSAVTGLCPIVVHVLPGPHAEELARRIWESFDDEDLFEGAIDPSQVADVAGRGWRCRYKHYVLTE